jgi:hypothetical protein
MATATLDLTSIVSATGWTGATVANLSTSNDVRATDGTAGEVITAEITDAPGDYGSGNHVNLYAEWSVSGTTSRAKNLLLELTDAAGTTVHATFTTPSLTANAADSVHNSSNLTLNLSASALSTARLRTTVQEGGGMADSITVRIDHLKVTLDYNVATPGLPKQMHHYKQMMGAA